MSGGSVSAGVGSESVSSSAGAGGVSTSAGTDVGVETSERKFTEENIDDYTDPDSFKEDTITGLTDSDLDKVYSDYKDYYGEVEEKVLPAETDSYQVALTTGHNPPVF